MSVLCFQVNKLPDLSLNKYQSLADTGIDGVLKRHESFLRQWHGICQTSETTFHLLYVYVPDEALGQRLKLFFMLQGEDVALGMIKPLLANSPLSDFFTFEPAQLPKVTFGAGATMVKKERVADIYNPLTNQITPVHYVPEWDMNDGARLYDLFRLMKTLSESYTPAMPCAFRIDLYPASMAQETRQTFQPILKSLRGENDIKLLRDSESVKADSYARDICKEHEDWLTSIETQPHFRVNMYGFADSVFKAKVLLNAAGSEALDEGDFAIAPLKADADGKIRCTSRMGQTAETYCFYGQQAGLKSWSTTFCLSEVVPFFRLPVLYDGEVIEIPKETAPVSEPNGLYLGEDMNGYPVNFPLKYLPRHGFFTGMPGSGKTNTMLHLVSQLRKHKIPFLALEPAKKEYRALLGDPNMQNVYLFSPHLQSHFPLQLNPLEFPQGVQLSSHINALLEVFQGTFMLEGPTYKFLSSAIQRSYEDLGWDMEDVNDEDCELPFPNLQNVYDNLQVEIEQSSYDGELKGNMRSFLQVRLGGLMERDAGELYNVSTSTLAPEQWLQVSAIVELEVLGEQAKNFFILMICHYILETLRANPSGGVNAKGEKLPVRHVMFIEEAHNIIAPSAQQAGADSVDPKISATAYIVKMLAEVRALREAIIIADQLPTALATEVTKNTGLKLVHRLTAQDDRQQIGTAISASALQLERMANFTTGRAYIHHEKTQKPFEVQIAEWKVPKVPYNITNDSELYAQVCTNPKFAWSTDIAFQNWADKYVAPFYKSAMELMTRYVKWINDYGKNLVEKGECVAELGMLQGECTRIRKKCKRLEKLWLPKPGGNPSLREKIAEVNQKMAQAEAMLAKVKFPE